MFLEVILSHSQLERHNTLRNSHWLPVYWFHNTPYCNYQIPWIRVMTYRHLGRFFRFEASIQKDHELIVSGPYAVFRHPSYTGLMLVFIGWFPWQLGKGSWGHGVGVVEHDSGEDVRHGVLYHIPLQNRLPCIGKNVEGGYSTQERV